ncbi:hypothetical protein [Polymorphospora rubra]|uniref:SH3 domain-containing protein n=1 Tax=Polymorphospora rubra TaxID=338584 RepID=A0A810NE62_9ACTN|nr:hypothetical protein [Polymorphospora rubra]BCJ69575.1 hypothetical protein Prubr_65960 [Polymorphospora rubra]
MDNYRSFFRRSFGVAAVAAVVAAGALVPAPASAAVPPRICEVVVVAAGDGQAVRSAPGFASAPLYTMSAGNSFSLWGTGITLDNVKWKPRTLNGSAPVQEWVPVINVITGLRYVGNEFCDRGV